MEISSSYTVFLNFKLDLNLQLKTNNFRLLQTTDKRLRTIKTLSTNLGICTRRKDGKELQINSYKLQEYLSEFYFHKTDH